ncbi:MAG: lysylphosphatidylglycerol synthase transmembrane domain-containing protein [Clostridium sp.]
MTDKFKKNALYVLVMIVLAGITFYVLLKDCSMETLGAVLKTADFRFILLGLVFMLLFASCEAAIMRLLARTWKGSISWGRAMQYSMAGFYFSSITPSSTGGQPMQLYYMVRDGIGGINSSFVLMVITAVYQMISLFYGLVMIVFHFAYIMNQPAIIKFLLAFGIFTKGISVLFILTTLYCKPLVERIVRLIIYILVKLHMVKHPVELDEKVGNMVDEYSRGGVYLRKYPGVILKIIGYTFMQLTFLYTASYCGCLSLGLGTVRMFDFISIQSIVNLAVSSVPLPGAVGASESSFLVLFRMYIPATQILPVMLLGRGISFYGFLIISGLVVLFLQFRQLRMD